MSRPAPRPRAERIADTRAMLATPEIDVWVSTADGDRPHLVPLSLGWVDDRIVVAVPATSRTAANLSRHAVARLAVGPTRDVVMIDAVLEQTVPATSSGELGEAYAAQADWDPRADDGYVFLVLRPERIQAWREA